MSASERQNIRSYRTLIDVLASEHGASGISLTPLIELSNDELAQEIDPVLFDTMVADFLDTVENKLPVLACIQNIANTARGYGKKEPQN